MSGGDRGLILVVDDDADIREILQIALPTHGYRVETARNGRECMDRLRDGERPSIILLDLMMPDMNGWAVCAQISKDSSLADLPVVILTGNAELRDERLGTYAVVRKPVGLEALLSTIERSLQRK